MAPLTAINGVSAQYDDTPLQGIVFHLEKPIPPIRQRPFPSNGRVRTPPPTVQFLAAPRQAWPLAAPTWEEVERLEGYVRQIEDDWADVILKTVQGHRLEVWFPLHRLKREGLAYPGAAFQYVVKAFRESVRSEFVPVEIPDDAPWLERMRAFDVSAIANYLAEQSAVNG